MEKKHTLIYFIGAIAFIVFGILLFKVANETMLLEKTLQEDGSYEQNELLLMVAVFSVCILCLAGLIVVLNEGEFSAWLSSAAVIVGVNFVGFFIGISSIASTAIAGLYGIWWLIAALRSVISTWGENEYWESTVMAIGRVVVALTLISFVLIWMSSFMTPADEAWATNAMIYKISGIMSIVSGAALAFEGFLWYKYLDY